MNESDISGPKAISDLLIDCHAISKQLLTKCEKIRASASVARDALARNAKEKKDKDSWIGMQTAGHYEKFVVSLKSTLRESEFGKIMSKMDSLKTQLILRMLLVLESKADEDIARHERHEAVLKDNKSNLVEILAIYQKEAQASLHQVTGRILDRLNSSEQAIAAILTMRNGDRKVIRYSGDRLSTKEHHVSTGAHQRPSDQTIIRMRSVSGFGNQTEATVRNFDPLPLQTAILRSLAFRHINDRFDMVDPPYKETYEWIFSDPKTSHKPWSNFPLWLSNKNVAESCYWVNGKAGSGKSTLMKYISQDPRFREGLERWAHPHRLSVTSFFFRNLGNNLQNSQEGLLRSILFGVFSEDPQLMFTVMHELYFLAEAHDDNVKIDPPSLAELLKWTHRLLRFDYSLRFCFLIDGIDEYDGDPAIIVDMISSLANFKPVKFILSSRPIPVCVDSFFNFPQLRLQDLTRNDIHRYTEGELMPRLRKRAFSLDDCNDVVEQIVNKSCGVFIWVVLSVRSLHRGLENRDRLDELQTRLRELPSDLEDLYSHMMQNMSHGYKAQAAHFFRIAMAMLDTSNPQKDCPFFTIQASFVDEEPDYLDKPVTELPEEIERSRCEEIEGRIRSRCCGLLETRRALPSEKELMSFARYEYPCVDFLHRTVVEFLSDRRIWEGIIRQSHADYNPSVVLFHSCVRTCKILPLTAEISHTTNPMWRMMSRALVFASRAEDLHTPVSRAHLHDLDMTISRHWVAVELFDGRDPKCHWAKKLGFTEVVENMHGKSSAWALAEMLGPMRFPCVAIAYSLTAYFSQDSAFEPAELRIQKRGALLFRAAGVFLDWAWYGAKAPHRYRRAIDICEALLNQGADPNEHVMGFSGDDRGSVWEHVLSYANNARAVTKAKVHSSNGIFDEIGESFVRGFVRLVIILVDHGADVNHELPSRGSPRRALWILERYFSQLSMIAFQDDDSDALHSPEATDPTSLGKLAQEALDLMIAKVARRDSLEDLVVQSKRGTQALATQHHESGRAWGSTRSFTNPGSIIDMRTETTLEPPTSSLGKDKRLVRRLTSRVRAFIK